MNQQEILTGLVEQLARQSMQLTVLHSAYVVLARQLEFRGALPLTDLETDLRTMAAAQPDEEWRSCHEALAAAVCGAHGQPTAAPRCGRLRRLKGL